MRGGDPAVSAGSAGNGTPTETGDGVHQEVLGAQLFEFVGLVEDAGIKIGNPSILQSAVLELQKLKEMRQGHRAYNDTDDFRGRWRAMLGLIDLARKVRRVRRHKDFGVLVPHFRYLAEAKSANSLAQNAPSSLNDQPSNHLFELLMAAIVMSFATDVSLDPPKSKGTNPDVMFTFEKQRWALACKVMDSKQPRTLMDRITEGVRQIEKSSADKGIVFVNFKNLFPHDEMWRKTSADGEATRYEVWLKPEFASRKMVSLFNEHMLTPLSDGQNATEFKSIFHNRRKAIPLPGCYVFSTASVRVAYESRMLPLQQVHKIGAGRRVKWRTGNRTFAKAGRLFDKLMAASQSHE